MNQEFDADWPRFVSLMTIYPSVSRTLDQDVPADTFQSFHGSLKETRSFGRNWLSCALRLVDNVCKTGIFPGPWKSRCLRILHGFSRNWPGGIELRQAGAIALLKHWTPVRGNQHFDVMQQNWQRIKFSRLTRLTALFSFVQEFISILRRLRLLHQRLWSSSRFESIRCNFRQVNEIKYETVLLYKYFRILVGFLI